MVSGGVQATDSLSGLKKKKNDNSYLIALLMVYLIYYEMERAACKGLISIELNGGNVYF